MTEPSLPPLRLVTCDAARREPGMQLFNVRPAGTDRDTVKAGWIIGIGRTGDVVFQQKFDAPTQDVRINAAGNIIFSQPGPGLITEIDRKGRQLAQWHAAGKWKDATPPAASVAIDMAGFHHTIDVLPGGNLLLLGNEAREFETWPGSDTDPDAPAETAQLIGDVVVEVTPAGVVEGRWHLLDILDPYRICYGSRRDTPANRDWPDSFDWAHANCASYDRRDDSILVSLRTQDCIIKFDRGSGDLKWILGPPGNWRKPWSDKLLTPKGDLEWQYHQHDCSVTPAGNILCFDNGNHRALPFDPKMAAADSYSRAVEFAIDEATLTVEQVWSYGDGPGDRLFGCFQGGARRLPKTGNTFITYGGVATMDGAPSADNANGFGNARLIEVTPEGQVVFDLWVDAGALNPAMSLSVFRTEHVPD